MHKSHNINWKLLLFLFAVNRYSNIIWYIQICLCSKIPWLLTSKMYRVQKLNDKQSPNQKSPTVQKYLSLPNYRPTLT